MTGEITKKEDELFKRWCSAMPAEERLRFVPDGLFDSTTTDVKVLFALKDAYDNTSDATKPLTLDLRCYGRDEAKSRAWVTMAAWAYGIKALPQQPSWPEVTQASRDGRLQALQGTGLMNIKKTASHQPTTNVVELAQHGEDYGKYIQEQWLLYKPNITICGSWRVFDALCKALCILNKDVKIERGMKYVPFQVDQKVHYIIEACHPAARYPAAMKYYSVVDLVDWLLKSEQP